MSDSNEIPVDRIQVFDREGIPIAEFRATVMRSWILGGEGRAAFTYPSRKTDIVNKDVLRFGNWILIQNSVLPPWVGTLDTPREWSPRNVTITAFTSEHVFGWRRGPLEEKITGSAGTVFEKLLQYVNRAEATILRAGDIFRGGVQREETINPTLLSRDLERIFERSGEEYAFRPVVSGGRLIVYCDWSKKLGVDTGVLLHEGKGGGNIESVDNVMVEDGPIVNDLLAAGDGESWVSKPVYEVTDATSRGEYGLRQDSQEYTGVTNTRTLRDNGETFIATAKDPTRAYNINALNVGDTFQYIALGNRFNLRFENVGFTGEGLGFETTVRILAMMYNPQLRNKIELVVEDE